jgi:hypothetical protein
LELCWRIGSSAIKLCEVSGYCLLAWYFSPGIIRLMKSRKMGGACSTQWSEMKFIRGFGGKTRRNETIRSPRRGWEDNIKMDLREVGWGGVGWINLVQDRD